MAVREAKLRISVLGDDNYKRSIADMKKHTEALKNELKGVEAAFKGNTDSMEYLQSKSNALNKIFDSQTKEINNLKKAIKENEKQLEEYNKQLPDTKKRYDEAKKALEEYNDSGKKNTEQHKRLAKEYAEAEKELRSLELKINSTTNNINNWEKALSQVEAEHKATKKAIDDTTNALDHFNDEEEDTRTVTEKLSEVLALSGIVDNLKEIAGALADCMSEASKYETAFADVIKTVQGTDEQIATLNDDILTLSTRLPYSADQIATIASLGGQLGIPIDNLNTFTEIMLGLGSATSLTAENASTAIAQFMNINGLPIDKLENFASALVDLGNNSATTETKIMDMTQRIAPSAKIVDMSAQQILGMATALSSAGIEADAGGTAISKLITKIADLRNVDEKSKKGKSQLQAYADLMGISVKEVKNMASNDVFGALQLLIQGINKSEDAFKSLTDIDVSEVRLKNALLSLATAEKDSAYYTEIANKAFEENTALMEEVSKRNETTESKNQLLQNSFQNLKIAIGQQLNPIVNNFSGGLADIVQKVTKWVQDNPKLVKSLSVVITTLAGVAAGVLSIVAAIKLINTVRETFSKTSPIYLALSAMVALVTTVVGLVAVLDDNVHIYEGTVKDFTKASDDARESMNQLDEDYSTTMAKMKQASRDAAPLIERLEELESKSSLTNGEMTEYKGLLEKLKAIYPDLNFVIDEETGLLQDGARALWDQVDAWEKKVEIEAKQERLKKLYQNKYEVEDEINANNKEIISTQGELKKAKQERADAITEWENKTGGKWNDAYLSYYTGTVDISKIDQATQKVSQLEQKTRDLNEAQKENRKTYDEVNHKIDNTTTAIEEETKATEDNSKATEDNTKKAENNASKVHTRAEAEQVLKKAAEETYKVWRQDNAERLGTEFITKAFDSMGIQFEKLSPALQGLFQNLASKLHISVPLSGYISSITKMGAGVQTYTTNNNQKIYISSTGSNAEKSFIETYNKVFGSKI